MDEQQTTASIFTGQRVPIWTEANVRALHEDILDIFAEHADGNGWFRVWRAAHPTARLT